MKTFDIVWTDGYLVTVRAEDAERAHVIACAYSRRDKSEGWDANEVPDYVPVINDAMSIIENRAKLSALASKYL